jgi:hypothetical protein
MECIFACTSSFCLPKDNQTAVKSFLCCLLSFDQTVTHNAYHEDPYAQEFGIRIDERLASVEARVLPPPRVSEFSSMV